MGDNNQTSSTYDVFISYSSKDVEVAETLYKRLVEANFIVWFDKARLLPSCNWHDKIREGCKASRVLLPVLTPSWKGSTWTRYETYGAEAVLPLFVSGEIEHVLTPPLSRVQAFPIDPLTASDDEWNTLFQTIKKLLAKPHVEKGERTAHLRYRPNPNFVGREQDLLKIHEKLYQTPTAALTQGQAVAVNAMGGVGKTTLAREYAEHYWRLYEQILWVDSRAGLVSEFARLAEIFNPQLKEATDANEKAAFAMQVLNDQTERLLILDNIEDEESVQTWIPKAGGCHTIITSRFSGWSSAVQTLHVYVLEPDSARELLMKKMGRESQESAEIIDELAKELGYLPLALEQAAAFVREEGDDFSFDDYLRLYQQSTKELLAEGVLGSTEYPDSVMTTWRATMKRLEDNPLARSILCLVSFYGSGPIPQAMFADSIDLLQQQAARLKVDESSASAPTASSTEMMIRKSLKELARYSMIVRHGHSFDVHALVQTVQRLEISNEEQRTWLETALAITNEYCTGDPQDVRTWPKWESVSPHIAAVVRHADEMQISYPTTRLMSNYGTLLLTKGQFTEAEPLYRRALAIDETAFGPEHPNVAIRLNSLAELLRQTNRLKEAEPLYRRGAEIFKTQSGESNPYYAGILNNLATLLTMTNRLEEAEPLMRQVASVFQTSYGEDHPHVATALSQRACLLQSTNRLAEAEPLYRRALDIDEAAFGPEHPKIATRLSNLAQLLHDTNRLAEAEPLYRRALGIDEAAFGPEHPKVATRLSNLSQLLHETYRLEEAEPLMRRALEMNEVSYGSNHSEVATSLNNLAVLLHDTNRLAEAESLYRRALAIDEATFGPEHPKVANDLGNLGLLLKTTNRPKEADTLYRRALAIDEAAFGPEHPNVANDLGNLAQLLQKTNQLEEAEPMMRRALAIDEAAFGPEHPKVASDLGNLAQLLQVSNRLTEAEPLMRRALAIHEDSYGPKHPDVATALNDLAMLLQATNRLEEAEPLQRRALTNIEVAFGPEHPKVAMMLNNLGKVLQATNRLEEAEQLMQRSLAIYENSYGQQHPDVAMVLNNLALLLQLTNRLEKAEVLLRRSLAIKEASYESNHPDVAISLNNLADLLQATNRLPEAESLYQRARSIYE